MSRIYCGRPFASAQIDLIRTLIAAHPQLNRAQLARGVCAALQWQGAGGRSKQMSCRVALLRMHDFGANEEEPGGAGEKGPRA